MKVLKTALFLLAVGCSSAPPPAPPPPAAPEPVAVAPEPRPGIRLLFFIGAECPVSNFYAPEIGRLGRKQAGSAVVYADGDARSHAAEYRLDLPAMTDGRGALARACGVRRVPTAVLLGADGSVLYRGRIDDRYSPDGKRRNEPRTRDLEDALDAVAAGRKPAVSETPVFGCPLLIQEAKQ